jgi:hypothetical protein
MATKAVKTLDKNFHIPLKLNDLPISVAVGLFEAIKAAAVPGGGVAYSVGVRALQALEQDGAFAPAPSSAPARRQRGTATPPPSPPAPTPRRRGKAAAR